MTEDQIRDNAITFARRNKKSIAKRLTSKSIYFPEKEPVSVFMAGSPGAGKTESSLALLETFKLQHGQDVLRIDPDELRCELPGYTGNNSWLFQFAVSILVDKIHDTALDQKQSFLLDGTLANYDIAKKNIERSIKRNRFVQILYVYQEPKLAWKFALAREHIEGRRIPLESFIEQYFSSRRVVNTLKQNFQKKINVDLLIKNNDNSLKATKQNISEVDGYLPEKYTPASLHRELIHIGEHYVRTPSKSEE
ncbi:zeta toxin family protein [Halomonas citrativorans]|uniref:zeta toxin family protein n=1 Tax=Halomonas citrativorans TaxID=2742612 RepID=UPI000B363A5C|nr:zeta toxin family protein [Halomonas citrativorans]